MNLPSGAPIVKHSSMQIVLTPWWILVFVSFGWLFVLAGVLLVLSAVPIIAYCLFGVVLFTTPVQPWSLSDLWWTVGVGIPILLLGIWFAGLRTKMKCSPGSAYITVTYGMFPIFLPSLRTKRISREEARTAFVQAETRSTMDSSSRVTSSYTVYAVKVQLQSGLTLTIFDAGRERQAAEDLVQRIREFTQQ